MHEDAMPEAKAKLGRPALHLALARGLVGRCPNCGRGKLFRAYLKQVDDCAVCGERYGNIESDDAAPWFTMLIVGVLTAPLYFLFNWLFVLSVLEEIACFVFSIILLTMLILPRVKGILISAFWYSRLGSRGEA